MSLRIICRSSCVLKLSRSSLSNTQTVHRFFGTSKRASEIVKKKPRIVIIGSGWGGYKFLQSIDKSIYDVIVISPRNYFLFTPLLASTTVGTLEYRCVTEPVRAVTVKRSKIVDIIYKKIPPVFKWRGNDEEEKAVQYHEALVKEIDIKNQVLSCTSALSHESQFTLDYDKLIVACGAVTNDFNIPGVKEHTCFLKDIRDAKKIRNKLMELFETAQDLQTLILQDGPNPKIEATIRQLLHFVVVGGGPTGVEFSAELSDFLEEDVARIFPEIMKYIKLTLVDVAPTILSSFDSSLSDYTSKKFSREGIEIRTKTAVKRVEATQLIVSNGDPIPYGICVWSTGLKPNPLLDNIAAVREKGTGRLLTDQRLRVFENKGESRDVIPNIFAVGDCATIEGKELPCTAQVAKRKGHYLAKTLNKEAQKGVAVDKQGTFIMRDLGAMAYVGDWKAVVGLPLSKDGKRKWNESGFISFILWRSAYFTFTVSWRNKALIPTYWALSVLYGRDVSHFPDRHLK